MLTLNLTAEQLARVFETQMRGMRINPDGYLSIVQRADMTPDALSKAMAASFIGAMTRTFDPAGNLLPEAERPGFEPSPDALLSRERRALGVALQITGRGRFTERDIEAGLVAMLKAEGFRLEQQVRAKNGRADIVADDAVIEVKQRIDSWGALHKACGQAAAYAENLGKRHALVTAKSINEALLGKGHGSVVCVAVEDVAGALRDRGIVAAPLGQSDVATTDKAAA